MHTGRDTWGLVFLNGIIAWDSVLENHSERMQRRNPLLQDMAVFVLVKVGLQAQQPDARRRSPTTSLKASA